MRDCVHNDCYNCGAKKITVNRLTDCTSYEKSAAKSNSALFEAGIDFAASDNSVDTHVACTANCLFNRSDICIANGITVMGEKEDDALCMTFIKK